MPATTQAPASTQAPATTAAWTQKQLADAYLACLDPYNAIVKATNATLKKTTKAKVAAAAFGKFGDAIGTLGTCIRAIPWTELYAADVKAKLKADAATQVTAIQMAKASSWSVLNSYSKDMDKAALASAAASNLLRGDLGLPPPQ